VFRTTETSPPEGYQLGGHYWWTASGNSPGEAVAGALAGLDRAVESDGHLGIVGVRIALAAYPRDLGSHVDGWPNHPEYSAVVHGNAVFAAARAESDHR
jgi:hypothetical protein